MRMILPMILVLSEEPASPFVRQERAAENWLDAECREERRRHPADQYALGLGAAGNGALPLGECREVRARAAAGAPLDKVRSEDRHWLRVAAEDHDES